jgi:spermidine/putrescine transport system substrate-binding protein
MTDHLTRRELLRRAAAGGTVLTLPGLLAACGGATKATGTAGSSKQKLAKTLEFSNWTLYIDVNKQGHPTLDQFEKKTGVKVDYKEDINDNASFFGKIQGPLSRGQSINRDIIVMTDNSRYPSLLIKKGWVEKLDKSAIPNIKNLIPVQRHPSWDHDREFSLPWQSGMTGIAYNDKLTDPITSIPQLLEDKKLKGKVTVLSEMADSLALVMLANGDDPAHVTNASFNRAINRLQKGVDNGQIRQFTGNDYSGPLAKGDLKAAMSWSGDIVQLQSSNKHLHWNLPDDGGDIWTDNMLIPQGGNVFTASTYMNFVYEPKIAAEIEAYVNYISPVLGAKEVLLKTDPAIAKNTLIFPTKKMLDNVHVIDPAALSNPKYLTAWQNLVGA